MLRKSIVLALSFSTLSSITAIAQDQESSTKYNHFYTSSREDEKKISDIVKSMTLEEKIGQMTLVNMRTIKNESKTGDWDAIEAYHIGAILADGDEMPETNSPNLSDWQTQMHAIGSHTVTLANNNKTHIRLLLGTDAVHGDQHVANAVIFPHNIGLGATHDPELVKQIAAWTAYDIKNSGFNWAYAPTVAVVHDYRWGRTYESFGSDPAWIKRFANAYITGAQDIDDQNHKLRGVLTSTKHFLGDGNTDNGVDEGNVTVTDEAQFIKENYAGYEGAFSAGTGNVMISYSSITDKNQELDNVPMSVNEKYLKKYLFAEDDSISRFNGFTVSDYTAISKAARTRHQPFHETLAEAINAGLDMIMVSQEDIGNASADSDHSNHISAFREALKIEMKDYLPDGRENLHKITEERINQAVTHILQVKLAMGLIDDSAQATLTPPKGNENEVALEAAEESLVLLKNSTKEKQQVIPLSTDVKHIVLLGNQEHIYTVTNIAIPNTIPPVFDDIGTQSGAWRIKWQGVVGNQYADYDGNASSILTGITRVAPKVEVLRNPDARQLDSSEYTAKNTVVIAVIAEPPGAEFMADVDNDNPNYVHNGIINPYLPTEELKSLILNFDAQTLGTIQTLKGKNIPIVTVLLSGRPRVVNSSEDSENAPLTISDAFIAAWLPGTTGGEAIANAIFGKYHFGYKENVNTLSVPWPKDMEQIEGPKEDTPEMRLTKTGRLVCPSIRNPGDPIPLYDCGYGLKT